jgi:hypothetical protein
VSAQVLDIVGTALKLFVSVCMIHTQNQYLLTCCCGFIRDWHEKALQWCSVMWLWGCACDVVNAATASLPSGFTKGRENTLRKLYTCRGLWLLRVDKPASYPPCTMRSLKLALSNGWYILQSLWLYIMFLAWDHCPFFSWGGLISESFFSFPLGAYAGCRNHALWMMSGWVPFSPKCVAKRQHA